MKLTRRGLFAALVAAFVAKPAMVHAFDHIGCSCTGCQYARGSLSRIPTYDFYPDALAAAPNQLLTMQEITSESLEVLENNTIVLPSFYRE